MSSHLHLAKPMTIRETLQTKLVDTFKRVWNRDLNELELDKGKRLSLVWSRIIKHNLKEGVNRHDSYKSRDERVLVGGFLLSDSASRNRDRSLPNG